MSSNPTAERPLLPPSSLAALYVAELAPRTQEERVLTNQIGWAVTQIERLINTAPADPDPVWIRLFSLADRILQRNRRELERLRASALARTAASKATPAPTPSKAPAAPSPTPATCAPTAKTRPTPASPPSTPSTQHPPARPGGAPDSKPVDPAVLLERELLDLARQRPLPISILPEAAGANPSRAAS